MGIGEFWNRWSDACVCTHITVLCHFFTLVLQTNTQAFRNFLFSSGYSADAAMELWFRNAKGYKEEQIILGKGMIHEALDHLFTFTTVRVARIANDLSSLLKHNKFMDDDVPDDKTYRKSTHHRWTDQVSVYTLSNVLCVSISNCVRFNWFPIAVSKGQLEIMFWY